jgi:DNA-directed RNA polymerase subunit omega
MARITVEDCLKRVGSRFELVSLAAARAKMLLRGARPVVEADNREIVTSLREVAGGKVYFVEPEAEEVEPSEESTDQAEGKDPEPSGQGKK